MYIQQLFFLRIPYGRELVPGKAIALLGCFIYLCYVFHNEACPEGKISVSLNPYSQHVSVVILMLQQQAVGTALHINFR